MNKKILLSIICLLLAFFGGRLSVNKEVPKPSQINTEKEKVKNEIQDLQLELTKNLEGMSATQKLVETRKVYEKIFKVFLAYLGLRYEDSKLPTLKEAHQATIGLENIPEPNVAGLASTELDMEPNDEAQDNIQPIEEEVSVVDSKKIDASFKKLTKSIALRPLRNPGKSFRRSKLISKKHPLVSKISGSYVGKIILHDKKVWLLNLNTNLYYDEEKGLTGSVLAELSNEEHGVFSRSNSEGDNNSFHLPTKNRGIIVKISPDTFIHLTFKKQSRTFQGYLYEQDPKSKAHKLRGVIPALRSI